MKRIEIRYGGDSYSIGGREPGELMEAIAQAVDSGGAWLEVNDGEGQQRTAFIHVAPGTPIALVLMPGSESGPSDG